LKIPLASVDACTSLFILKIKWFYKNIIKKPLSPNGERGLEREVKKIISF
jgi:hypothetical protein